MDEISPAFFPSEEKSREISFKFFLPDNQDDFDVFLNADRYKRALDDIYNECRTKWKYDEKASEELRAFAERIGKMCLDGGLTF